VAYAEEKGLGVHTPSIEQ